jgi:hypothetical protein
MQIVNNIEQGSEEWLNLRLGKATVSNFSKIVTSTGKESTSLPKYALQLASDILVTKPEETYKNESMQRGNDLEPLAREAYQEHTLNIVDEVAFYDCIDFGYSPDGLIGKDGLVEFKCPQATTHTQYLFDNKLPTTYKAQCQGGLMVTGRKWLDFCSFHPNFQDDKKLFITRVERDEEFIEKLQAGIDKVIELRNEFIKKIKNNGQH